MPIRRYVFPVAIAGVLLSGCARFDLWRSDSDAKAGRRVFRLAKSEALAAPGGVLLIIRPSRHPTVLNRSTGRTLRDAAHAASDLQCGPSDVAIYYHPVELPLSAWTSSCEEVLALASADRLLATLNERNRALEARLATVETQRRELEMDLREIQATVARAVQFSLYLETIQNRQSRSIGAFNLSLSAQTEQLRQSNAALGEIRTKLDSHIRELNQKVDQILQQLRRF